MIRFIPDYSKTGGGSSKNEVEGISLQLTKGSGDIFCQDHSEYDNQMMVAVASNGFGVKILDVCCENFRQSLIEHYGDFIY